MKTFASTPTLIALALAGVLASCGKSNTPSTPPATSSSSTTITTPASPPSTPPASSTSSTTTTTTIPGPSTRLDNGGTLARARLAEFRTAYGVELTRVADKTTAGVKLSRADRGFLKDAAVGGLYEVEAAQVASERAHDPAVKSFAQTLVKEHSATNAELKQLATSRNVDLPSEPTMLKRRAVDRMRKSNDRDFDRDFVQKIGIKDHQDDIKLFEKASRNAKDPEIRSWAEKKLPTLRQHLADARSLPGADKAGAGKPAGDARGSAMGNTTGSKSTAGGARY